MKVPIKKVCASITLCGLLCGNIAFPANATDILQSTEITSQAVKSYAQVMLASTVQNIPQDIVNDLASSYPGSVVTITAWGEATPTPAPRIVWLDILSKSTTARNVVAADNFIISVAKGASTTLSREWSASLNAECSVAEGIGALSLNSSITSTISVEQTFNGPPEESSNNSREYRMRFYEDQGTFVGQWASDMGASGSSFNGTWSNPTKYAQYSVDYRS